jgi:hypothetical protein
MPSTATAFASTSLDAVEKLFEIGDVPGVRRYLDGQPTLVPLLVEARRAIPRYFPDPTGVRLELLADRDDGDHVDLFAIIRTVLPEDEALRRLDRFDEEWWLEAAVRGNGHLTIDVESVP